MHRALLLQEIGGDQAVKTNNRMTEQQKEEDDPSLMGIALAQWLAWLSTRRPFMSKGVATALFVSILLLPLIIAVVCFLFVQPILGGIFAILFSLLLSFVLFEAKTHSRYPRTEQHHRASLRTIQFRFGQVRAKRFSGYDLYLPPGLKTSIKCAFLLIPNEKVDHLAYAGIASILSDAGILVVIQNTEPYRLPSTLVGSGYNEISEIKRQVQQEYAVKEWALGGHGLGSIPATLLVDQLNVNKLVIWGACPSWNIDLTTANLSVLVVIGSNDGYWTSQSEEEKQKFKSLLPPRNERTVFIEMMEGGNHAGFAHYGPIPQDGERTIRLEEQQKKAATITSLFLKNAPSGSYVPPSSASV